MRPLSSLLLAALLSAAALCQEAWAQIAPPTAAVPALGHASDRIVVQLTPAASRAAFTPAPRAGARRRRLGLTALDALLAASPGAWLEPEFRGDAPPAPGSAASDFSAFYVVHLPRGASTADAVSRFRGLGEVREAHEIGLAPVTSMPNDSLWSLAYHLYQPSRRDVHALEAWDQTLGDTSQVVAVIDTGLLPYHPDISGRTPGSSGQIWTNWAEAAGVPGVDDDLNGFVDDVHGWDFVDLSLEDGVPGEDVFDEDNDPNDFVGHGTAVAGLVGALTDNGIGVAGTARRVRILPLRVGWSSIRQAAGIVDMTYVAEAVRYATQRRVNVINISLANTYDPDLELAVGAALDSNIVVVLAAGNNSTPNALAGRYASVIIVAATDRNDVVPVWSSRFAAVDLAAPGDLVPTTILSRPGTDSLGLRQPSYVPDVSGTSFAAPIVAGAVVLVQARRHELGLPPLTTTLMDQLLRATCDDISAQNPGITGYGAGRLDIGRAVTAGSRVRFSPLVLRNVGPGVSFSTNAGDSRIAYVNEGGRMLFLDPNTLGIIQANYVAGAPTGGIAAADLGHGRGLGLFVSIGSHLVGLGAGGAPLPGWPVDAPPYPDALVGTPVLGDLDGEGSTEIVCGSESGRIWAWQASGAVFPGFPITPIPLGSLSPLALANLDGQPGAEILAGSGHLIRAFRWTGDEPPGWPIVTNDGGFMGPVVTTAANGDTVVVVANAQWVRGFHPDGSPAFQVARATSGVSSDPALGDLDADGIDDVVVSSPTSVEAYDLRGNALPGWPQTWTANLAGPPVIDAFAAGDTQTVVAHGGVKIYSWSGSGRPLSDFPPIRQGDPFGEIVVSAPPGGLRLVAGMASEGTCYAYDGAPDAIPSPAHAWPTPRGNFARTGSRLDSPPLGQGDVVPPPLVSDLGARPFGGQGSVMLTWTAPADDGPAGKAAEYDVRTARFAENLIANPGAYPRLPAALPHAAGYPESLFVSGLPFYDEFFAIRSRDASGNWSPFTAPIERQGSDPLANQGSVALTLGHNPSTAPFPFLWQENVAGTSASLRIYDVGGRRVRTLPLGSGTNGVAYWDGTDDRGNFLPAGVYVAALGSDPAQVRRRFVLLR